VTQDSGLHTKHAASQ